MKKNKFLALVSAARVGLALPASAGPRGGGGGGGGQVGGGGRVGGFVGGGSRAAPAFHSGGIRAAPAFRGADFTGRVGRPSAAPRFYDGGTRMFAVRPQGFTRSLGRSTTPYVGRSVAATRQPNRVSSLAARNHASDTRISTATNRQPNRAGSVAVRNRVSDPRTSTAPNRRTAANRQSFV